MHYRILLLLALLIADTHAIHARTHLASNIAYEASAESCLRLRNGPGESE
jgi:hypothetical protein